MTSSRLKVFPKRALLPPIVKVPGSLAEFVREEVEMVPHFAAVVDGVEVEVTAVLERTAVIEVAGDITDRKLVRLDRVFPKHPRRLTFRPFDEKRAALLSAGRRGRNLAAGLDAEAA